MADDLNAMIAAGAEQYVEAADRPIAGGRWFILAGDEVVYQRPGGEYVRDAVVRAVDLRSSPTWRRVDSAGDG